MSGHNIVHIEIPSTDGESGSKFYGDAFGWKNSHAEQFNYWMFQPEEGPGGGFPALNDEFNIKPGEILIYIGTDNLEESLAKVESLGGKTLTGRMPIPGMGAFAFFEDPTGNRVGLFENEPMPATS